MIEPTFKISTPDSLDYSYFPTTKNYININVIANHDARICLRNNLTENSDHYEIIIGGWGNTMSAIKKNHLDPDVAEARTPGILKVEEDMGYLWIQWSCDGYLRIGHENEDCFMSFFDTEPFVINYIGLSTAWGATGDWEIDGSDFTAPAVRQQLVDTARYWIDYDNNHGLPRNATAAHEDGLYIGRCHHNQSVTPGGIRGSSVTLTWGGHAHEKSEFQVLCDVNVEWVKSTNGSVPLYAFVAGETEDGNALFIGRIHHNGTYKIGKIQPNHQACYIPIDGREIKFSTYETMVLKDNPIYECVGR